MAKRAPRIPESEWEKQKQRIVSLYLAPQSTLEHTIALMKEIHGFEASKNQYRTKLKLWKVGKNATRDMYIWVDRTIKRRALEGKATDVFLHEKPLSRKKLAKEIARNVTFTDSLANLEVSTPEGITVATPAAGSAGAYDKSVVHLPSLQLRDEVLGFVTDIICSARVGELSQYLLALGESDGILHKEVNKSLWMWPEGPPLEMNLSAKPSNPSITHSTCNALDRIGILPFLAINTRVSWRVLYSTLQPFINHRAHSFLSSIYSSKTTSTRTLCRLFLYGAVDAGHILVAREILESGIKITSQDGLMTLAFRRRNPKLVELLCKKGVPLEISEYPPDIFTKAEDVQMLRLLLEAGADPESVIDDETVGFPLTLAAKRGSMGAVQLLLRHGARGDLYFPSKYGSALQAATAYGHCDIVKALLSCRSRAAIDVPSNSKYRPLLATALQIPHCDVALSMQIAALTPIQIAAANNDLEMARLLQGHGAHLNSRPTLECQQELREDDPFQIAIEEHGGLTALQYAIANENTKLVSLLLSSGAYWDLVGHVLSDTPLQMSARLSNEGLVRILLNYGAKVNAPPSSLNGRTALQAAAETGNLQLAELLLNAHMRMSMHLQRTTRD